MLIFHSKNLFQFSFPDSFSHLVFFRTPKGVFTPAPSFPDTGPLHRPSGKVIREIVYFHQAVKNIYTSPPHLILHDSSLGFSRPVDKRFPSYRWAAAPHPSCMCSPNITFNLPPITSLTQYPSLFFVLFKDKKLKQT